MARKKMLSQLNNNLENIDFSLIAPRPRTLNRSNSFRSALMLSAHNLKHLRKIPLLEAECVILNLEDGVSAELKPLALSLAAATLSTYFECDKKLIVRINALDEGGESEISYLNDFRPDAIRIPKIRDISDVERALELVDDEIDIYLSIETARAWQNLGSLAIDTRVRGYFLGILDLLADLGLSQAMLTPQNPTIRYILSHFLITSLASGIKPISFVYQDFKNLDGFREFLALEREMGFSSKGCISPQQTEILHEIFRYSDDELARSRHIIELFESHKSRGITGFVDERYGFIDEPIYKDALNKIR